MTYSAGELPIAATSSFATASHLQGMSYLQSETKVHFDQFVGSTIAPLAKAAAYATEFAIYGSIDSDHTYTQLRAAESGTAIAVKKIRTMTEPVDGEEMDIDRYSPRIVNKRARFARIVGLDELPQWEMVTSGEMSIVGPRPMLTETVDRFSFLAEAAGLHTETVEEWRAFVASVRPGIFGISQAKRHMRSFDEYSTGGSRQVVEDDLRYKAVASLTNDMKISLHSMRTTALEGVKGVLSGKLARITK